MSMRADAPKGTAADRSTVVSQSERRAAILEFLRARESASVAELGAQLSVTEMTIRRDLEALEGEGVLKRFHGGAKITAGSSYEPPLAVRQAQNADQKRAIANEVANALEDGSTVVIDGGSTGIAVAEALVTRRMTICPLSLRVAWVFARSTSVQLILPPGAVRSGELSISGADTVAHLSGLHFDRFVMTASAFSAADGFTEWNVEDAAVKRAAMRNAAVTLAAVDSSKYGRTAFAQICAADGPDVVVVDDGLAPDAVNSLRSATRRLALAS